MHSETRQNVHSIRTMVDDATKLARRGGRDGSYEGESVCGDNK